MQPGRHALPPEQHDAQKGGLEEERRQHLVSDERAYDIATTSEKRLQFVPNWYESGMPETTPMAKDTREDSSSRSGRGGGSGPCPSGATGPGAVAT